MFGAGATHAELQNVDPDLDDEKTGLLIRNVSSRVIAEASRDKRYRQDVETVSGIKGSLNIELLISLIENSKVPGWEYKTHVLKTLVEKDIKGILVPARTRRFYLHKALFQYHQQPSTTANEKLIGVISLNYDHVADDAYQKVLGSANYSLSLDAETSRSQNIPLLKLHGSFNWDNVTIRGRRRRIEIIPMGSSKSYLHAPYGFIWNRALEVLIECDVLRVVGCSLSQNDAHLVDLLFKAQLERRDPFGLQIIDSVTAGDDIRRNYGFFPNITTLSDLGGISGGTGPANPFAAWLKSRTTLLKFREIASSPYVRRILG